MGKVGDHAYRRLSVLLRVFQLRRAVAAEAGRLLRVLFLRLSRVPADPVATRLLQVAVNQVRRIVSLPPYCERSCMKRIDVIDVGSPALELGPAIARSVLGAVRALII